MLVMKNVKWIRLCKGPMTYVLSLATRLLDRLCVARDHCRRPVSLGVLPHIRRVAGLAGGPLAVLTADWRGAPDMVIVCAPSKVSDAIAAPHC